MPIGSGFSTSFVDWVCMAMCRLIATLVCTLFTNVITFFGGGGRGVRGGIVATGAACACFSYKTGIL